MEKYGKIMKNIEIMEDIEKKRKNLRVRIILIIIIFLVISAIYMMGSSVVG